MNCEGKAQKKPARSKGLTGLLGIGKSSKPKQPEPVTPVSPSSADTIPCLYQTHYSAPGYVVYYLVRSVPEYMLLLQKGKFDAPDRLFDSIQDCWASVNSNYADVKELIPEFYYGAGEFLENRWNLDLGIKQEGSKVRDSVLLPAWAHSPADFIRTMRHALEGKYVSQNLHKWIDLVFGNLQRGDKALAADNLFHPLTYDVDLDAAHDELERQSIEMRVQEFGQTPKQLFTSPHPQRAVQQTPASKISVEGFVLDDEPASPAQAAIAIQQTTTSTPVASTPPVDDSIRNSSFGGRKSAGSSGVGTPSSSTPTTTTSTPTPAPTTAITDINTLLYGAPSDDPPPPMPGLRAWESERSSSPRLTRGAAGSGGIRSPASSGGKVRSPASSGGTRSKQSPRQRVLSREAPADKPAEEPEKKESPVSSPTSPPSSSTQSSPPSAFTGTGSSVLDRALGGKGGSSGTRVPRRKLASREERGSGGSESFTSSSNNASFNREDDILDSWGSSPRSSPKPSSPQLPVTQSLGADFGQIQTGANKGGETMSSGGDTKAPASRPTGRTASTFPIPKLHSTTKLHKDTIHDAHLTIVGSDENAAWLQSQPGVGSGDIIVYSVSGDATAKITNLTSGKKLRSFGKICNVALSSVKLTHTNPPQMVLGGWDNNIYLFNPEFGCVADNTHAHDSAISAIALSSDDKIVMSASWDATVKMWQLTNSNIQRMSVNIAEHDEEVQCIDINPTNNLAVSAASDGSVVLYDIRQNGIVKNFMPHKERINACRWTADDTFVTCSRDNTIQHFGLHYDDPSCTIKTNAVNCITTFPNSSLANYVVACSDSECIAFDISGSGEQVATLPGGAGKYSCVCATTNLQYILAGDSSGSAAIWELQ
eukprot:TRINITY_DN48389_c0_g2_i1.p1 TRINITY_DN48389_c0_g2~~TRINITY_DN48389_c0_g2_i1.p1  ORF type:complete len:937 (+),score=108.29 TRINITY_DN48389_c0_g2_i1:176-2812(+)